MNFCSPLRQKKLVKQEPTELPLFTKEKLTLTKSEARKILHHSGDLSHSQVLWTQNWMNQQIRERCLPPQLSGADAFGQIIKFLSSADALLLLSAVRQDFARTIPQVEEEDLSFLEALANEAYHEHLSPQTTSFHNNLKSDDDL